jgi:hypothetical protein
MKTKAEAIFDGMNLVLTRFVRLIRQVSGSITRGNNSGTEDITKIRVVDVVKGGCRRAAR